MALTWRWNEKVGEAVVAQTIDGETTTYTKTLYEGNAFLIFLSEWDEDGKHMYNLYTFFADDAHAKRCLGLDKKSDMTNIFLDGWQTLIKLRINKAKCRNWKKIVTLFSQAFDDITIEIYTKEDET